MTNKKLHSTNKKLHSTNKKLPKSFLEPVNTGVNRF